jgi:hypothetical protein
VVWQGLGVLPHLPNPSIIMCVLNFTVCSGPVLAAGDSRDPGWILLENRSQAGKLYMCELVFPWA